MIRAVHLPATGPGPEDSDWKFVDESDILAEIPDDWVDFARLLIRHWLGTFRDHP